MNLKKFSRFELDLQDRKVLYLQSGKGPTILFLHGLGIGTNIWNQVVNYLSNKFTIILLDLPGYGLNSNLLIDTKFDVITKFISDFIMKKGSIDYLIGYSISGTFTYRIAQKPPASLKKILLISTPIFTSHSVLRLSQIFKIIGNFPLLANIVLFFAKHFPVKQLIFVIFGLASITSPKAMNDCMKKFGEKSNLSLIIKSASSIFSITKFSSINIPVDFIYGKQDKFATPMMANIAKSYCNNSRLYLVKNAYHLMPFEKPQKLAHLIEESCNIIT